MSQIEPYFIPRIVIGAISGGSGKTFVTTSMISAMISKNIRVAPFKKGPDFIDPKWLAIAAGRQCYNLDYHLFKDSIIGSFYRNSQNSDIAVIEGNHGFFDSIDSEGLGSTANLARILKAPVILVLNCRKLSRSIAPLINGFVDFEKDIKFAGVILNQVSGKRHEEKLREAIKNHCSVPVLGVVPISLGVLLEERHLGIITTEDKEDLEKTLESFKEIGSASLEIEKIMEAARSAPPLEIDISRIPVPLKKEKRARIAVARDEAFNFYYPDNLQALEDEGAELVYFSPLKDREIPEAEGIYLGGGYPEIYSKELSENEPMLQQIQAVIEKSMPVYAECGGMMYLCKNIDYLDREVPMSGVIRADCQMTKRPQGRGYVELKVQTKNDPDNFWEFPEEATIHAHEFHFSKLDKFEKDYRFAFTMVRGEGIRHHQDGLMYKNLVAGYTHLHFFAAPWWAKAFVDAAARFKKSL